MATIAENLARDFREIDAHHAVFTRQCQETKLLRILLRLERGEFVTLADRWLAGRIVEQYPEWADLVRPENNIPLRSAT